MLRKPAFWILFFLVSAAAAVFTITNFSTAFPLISVDVRMNRDGALTTARSLAEERGWPPGGFDQAAEFSGDQETQNFIELVGGDKLTEITHYVQIPEAFSRRYEEMRSANTAIGAAASIALFGLYLFGCCGIGLFFMIRQHWVLWRQATFWGVFLGLLMGLDQLNSWSLLWMGYDTAVPASGFAIRQIGTAFAIFAGLAILMTVSFMAAETLTRRAFPHHIQFWKVWSVPVSATKAVLGRTVSGYLLVSLFFAYEIVLYFFAQRKLGWWTPSDTLVNPNLFANYVPSLSAIAMAAQAGFWEESLFRAVPLATAALIGDRFGKRRTFLAGAMILQALIFASGH